MNDNARLHRNYMIGILLAVIIVLITQKWGDIPRLPELISFALAITSLVLAVLAIVQSHFSSESLLRTIGGLGATASTITTAADAVRNATADLALKVATFPDTVSSLSDKVEETRQLVLESSNRQAMSRQPEAVEAPNLQQLTPDERVERFASNTSIAGLFALLALGESFKRKRPLDLKAYSATVLGAEMTDYSYGYLMSADAAGILELERNDAGETGLNATAFPEALSEAVERLLPVRIRESMEPTKGKIGKDEDTITLWMGKIQRTKDFVSAAGE